MIPPSSCTVAQNFSSHSDWMLLERITRHMLTRATADTLPRQVWDLLQVSGSRSSCQALQWSLPTPQRAVQQKAALFISYLHLQIGFSQWTFPRFSKIFMYQSSFRHCSISTSWEICLSKFWKAQPATRELCCQNCWCASLPASADPVGLMAR